MTGRLFAFDAAVPACRLALPRAPHLPGTGSKPDWPAIDAAKALVPEVTAEAEWADNEAYLYGFALMRAGHFWEAHEVWEPVWLASPPNGRARILLRALIQTANARLKDVMGRPRAVVRLAEEARDEIDEIAVSVGEVFMGVDVKRMRADLRNLAAANDDEHR